MNEVKMLFKCIVFCDLCNICRSEASNKNALNQWFQKIEF